MIKDKLLNENYYIGKLPLFLQNSPTFKEHFILWVEFLRGLNMTSDNILKLVNVFDSNYIEKNGDLCTQFLDFIGNLNGVKRDMTLYYELDTEDVIQPGTDIEYDAELNNTWFLTLIRCQIIKNFFSGSYEELNKLYGNINLPIVYSTAGTLYCKIYYAAGLGTLSDNDDEVYQILFVNNLLTVESIGVIYEMTVSAAMSSIMIWVGEGESGTQSSSWLEKHGWWDSVNSKGGHWSI